MSTRTTHDGGKGSSWRVTHHACAHGALIARTLPPAASGLLVDGKVPAELVVREDDSVHAARSFERDEACENVSENALRLALERVPVSASAGRVLADELASSRTRDLTGSTSN